MAIKNQTRAISKSIHQATLSFILLFGLVALAVPATAQIISLEKTTYINNYNITCHGAADGAINIINVEDDNTPFTFLWSNGSTTEDLVGLTAGSYTVTVTNALGQSFMSKAELIQPDILGANIYLEDNNGYNIYKFGETGSITAEATGGSPPYNYLWSNNTEQSTAAGLIAGTYTVTITDQNGCSLQQTRTLTQPDELIVSLSSPLHNG